MDRYAQLAVALAAVFLFLAESLRPNHRTRFNWRWFARTLGLTVISLALVITAGSAYDPWLQSIRLSPAASRYLSNWPVALSGFLGYLCVSFLVYWWHRARHASNLLWRMFHQIHHSPARIEVLTTYYAHPADFLVNAMIVSIVAYALLGLEPIAAGWCLFWVGLFDTWEHTNVKTPVWLGYIIVRPEMHRVHHEYDKHSKNYGIPIWDMLFGTYENSARRVEHCGFDKEKEDRLMAMLAMKNVHALEDILSPDAALSVPPDTNE